MRPQKSSREDNAMATYPAYRLLHGAWSKYDTDYYWRTHDFCLISYV